MKRKLLILFTAIYVFCEVIYNIGLVEFLTSKNTEINVFEHLETFGKTLSSIGLSLIFLSLVKNSKLKVITFLVLAPSLYIAETVGFDSFIKNLSPETKVAGYTAAVYRNAVINGTISDDRFKELSAYNKVVLSNIMSLAESKAQINNEVSRLFIQSPTPDSINDLYSNYSKLTGTIEPYYANYAIESKRWDGFDGTAKVLIDKEFMRRTGGIPQGLKKEQFIKAVSEKSQSFKTYQEMVIIPGNEKLGIKELAGRDVPMGLTKEQFTQFVSSKFSEISNKTKISASNVEQLPHSFDLISSVFIPPLAIVLSLMSIILNTGILLSELSFITPKPLKSIFKCAFSIVPLSLAIYVFVNYSFNPYHVNEIVNKVMGVEATLFEKLTPLPRLVHSIAIDDNHPNESQIIRIKKAEPINFKDIEDGMSKLLTSSNQNLPPVDTRIIADEKRLQSDATYFGEIKTKVNPYTNQ